MRRQQRYRSPASSETTEFGNTDHVYDKVLHLSIWFIEEAFLQIIIIGV